MWCITTPVKLSHPVLLACVSLLHCLRYCSCTYTLWRFPLHVCYSSLSPSLCAAHVAHSSLFFSFSRENKQYLCVVVICKQHTSHETVTLKLRARHIPEKWDLKIHVEHQWQSIRRADWNTFKHRYNVQLRDTQCEQFELRKKHTKNWKWLWSIGGTLEIKFQEKARY
jgi:hypothetical protein